MMNSFGKMLLPLLVFLLSPSVFLFSDAPVSGGPQILLEKMDTGSPKELAFEVILRNPSGEAVRIKTEHTDIVDYRMGDYEWAKENEGLLYQPDLIILSGEKKIIRQFRHDLEQHPSPDPRKATVTVEVKGIGKITQEFELEKPSLFENFFGKLFQSKHGGQEAAAGNPAAAASPVLKNLDESVLRRKGTNQSQSFPGGTGGISIPGVSSQTVAAAAPANPQTNPPSLIHAKVPNPKTPPPLPVAPGPLPFAPDITPPAAPTVNALPQALATDRITVSGTKETGSSLLVNGIEMAPADNSTLFSFILTLQEGTNLLKFESKDLAGNTSGAVIASIIMDTIAPVIQSAAAGSITSNSATITVQASEAVTVSLTYDAAGARRAVPLQVQSNTSQTSHTLTLSNLSPNTAYDYFVTVTDIVSHTATSPAFSFTTRPPANPFEDPVAMPGLASRGSVSPRSVFALDDLNGDGIAEYGIVADARQDLPPPQNEKAFYAAYSSPDGTYDPKNLVRFSPTITLGSPGNGVSAIPVGDFNGDGFTDVFFTGDREAWLFHSKQQGGRVIYQAAQQVLRSGDGMDSAGVSGDFNGDGLADLVMQRTSYGTIIFRDYPIIFSNKTTGTYDSIFQSKVIDPAGFASQSVMISFSDVNGDGKQEVAYIANQFPLYTLKIFPSPDFLASQSFDTYTFPDSRTFPAGMPYPLTNVPDDLNDDGAKDLEILRYINGTPGVNAEAQVSIFYFNRNGAFLKEEPTHINYGQSVRPGDLNGDGMRDLLLVGEDIAANVYVFFIFYSKNGAFDFNAGPDYILKAPPVSSARTSYGMVTLRPRAVNGRTKYDLILRQLDLSGLADQYIDYLFKEK